MTSLPQVREHINAADFQTVATFLPPAGDGRTLAVSANEKAVILRGGRVVDMFSGGSKPVQKEDEIVVASLRKYQIIIGFGDCSASHYNFSPTRIHVSRPAFPIADGEEIRSMIVAVSFALDRDDRSNVEKLMTVGMANADAITVVDLAASLTALPHFVQSLIVSEPFVGPSIRANPERIAEIELQIQSAADGMLRRYGALSDGAALNVIATSRDAELAMPEKEREANAEHLLKLAGLHRESARLERQVEPMKRLLETERIAHQTEKIRTEIMQERLEQSRIHAEIERIDPRMGATIPAPGVPPSVPLNNPVAPAPESDATPDFATEDSAAADDGGARLRVALRGESDVNAKNAYGETPLHNAASRSNAEDVRVLIDAGADVNAKNDNGDTPLHRATFSKERAAVDALIAAGADVNAKNDDGGTPLYMAILFDRGMAAADALIAAGADVNAKNNSGYTPLHRAAYKGHRAAVDALIAAGADVNAKTNSGRTPLHLAAYKGHRAAVDALISAGADVNAKDKWDDTPLDDSTSEGHRAAADALRAAGARGS